MAAKQIDELIDDTLSEKQKDAMFELQSGKPDFLLDEKLVTSLDELDLVNRIQYTSVRSNESVMGYALSERGNQVVEEIKRRNQYEETRNRNDANSKIDKDNRTTDRDSNNS